MSAAEVIAGPEYDPGRTVYEIGVECRNCGSAATLRVPMGTLLRDLGAPCLGCGCSDWVADTVPLNP